MIRYLDNEAFLDSSLFLKKCYFGVFMPKFVPRVREHPVYSSLIEFPTEERIFK